MSSVTSYCGRLGFTQCTHSSTAISQSLKILSSTLNQKILGIFWQMLQSTIQTNVWHPFLLCKLPYCLSQGLYSWTKHHDWETSWGGKYLFSFHTHITVHHQRTETHTGQELGSRSWCRGHGGILPSGFLPLPCSACLLIEPRTTSPGTHKTGQYIY